MERVFIAGAASAIAQATARVWAARGAHFYLADKDAGKLAAVAQDLRARGAREVAFEALDLTDLPAHAELIARAAEALGKIDIVLVAHGILGNQEEAQRDFKEANAIIETNFVSAASLLTLLANRMEEQQHGVLAVVSSVAGDRGRQSIYVYGAAKGALSIFTDGLRNRLAGSGAHALTIKPGYVITPMTAHEDRRGLLWVEPERVARDIVRGVSRRRNVLYTPWFWRYIMLIIRLIPEPIFKKMSL